MKKNSLFAALVAVSILGACSKDEPVESAPKLTSSGGEIGYTTYIGKATRGVVRDCDNLKDTDFSVFGFLSDGGTQFMGSSSSVGAKIVYNTTSSSWVYDNADDKAYWGEVDMNFYAYSPTEGLVTDQIQPNVTNTAPKIVYETPTDIDNQVDLLYSTAFELNTNNRNGGTANVTSGGVDLCFKHALAQVLFAAKCSDASLMVDIETIELHNVVLGGTFTMPTSSIADPAWAAASSPVRGDFAPVSDELLAISSTEAKDITTTDKGALLLMPQTLTAWDTESALDADGDESYLKLTCKIYNSKSGVYLHGTKDKYADVYVPFGVTFKAGYVHTYTLVFGNSDGGSGGGGYDEEGDEILDDDLVITFTPSVCGWDGSESVEQVL